MSRFDTPCVVIPDTHFLCCRSATVVCSGLVVTVEVAVATTTDAGGAAVDCARRATCPTPFLPISTRESWCTTFLAGAVFQGQESISRSRDLSGEWYYRCPVQKKYTTLRIYLEI